MKIKAIFFVSILFVTPCFSQKDLLPVYPKEISYQNNRAYFNGLPFTGLLVAEKTNKKLGEFKNGYKNGFFIEFYANGKKKNSGNFVIGLKDGIHIEIFENGQKKSEYNYLNGVKNGIHSEWYENGKKKAEGNYLNGVKDGKHQEWYENGQEKSSYIYNIGKINNGTYLSYFENGKPEVEETFLDNEVTKNITYNIDGQYLSKEYVNEYYSDGTSIKTKGLLINELKEGLWVEYHENGRKSKESTFLNDKENGFEQLWDENGKKIIHIGYFNTNYPIGDYESVYKENVKYEQFEFLKNIFFKSKIIILNTVELGELTKNKLTKEIVVKKGDDFFVIFHISGIAFYRKGSYGNSIAKYSLTIQIEDSAGKEYFSESKTDEFVQEWDNNYIIKIPIRINSEKLILLDSSKEFYLNFLVKDGAKNPDKDRILHGFIRFKVI